MVAGTKFHVPVVFLSIKDNIRFKENLKQGFKRKRSSNKYRSEITTQPKNKNLGYMADPTFRNIDRLFVKSFKSFLDPTRNSFDMYYMP